MDNSRAAIQNLFQNLQKDWYTTKYTATPSGFRSTKFYFFTSSATHSLEEVAALYRKRVQVELFIRQLKQTLKLFFVRAKKVENLHKEIFIAYLTFNLMRGVMTLAARAAGIAPERVSFTATMTICEMYAASFLRASSTEEREKLWDLFVEHIAQTKLPLRTKQRSYPRVVKASRDKYLSQPIHREYKFNGRR